MENNLYGVDINAEAVEIAKLSLWLRTVESGRKLNKLADKIKVGNSLIDDKSVADDAFVWEEEFTEVFAQGGFDVVIGNPPYVRQELLSSEMKSYFKTKYTTHHNSADLYVFFIERGYKLLRRNGKFSFIFPNKWLKAKYGKPLREWLKSKHLEEVVDFGDLQIFQGATTYPMIMTLNNQEVSESFDFLKLETIDFGDLAEYVENKHSKVILNKLDDNAWQLVSKDVQNILDKTMQNSSSFGSYTEGKINRGILTGFNDAFVINEQTKNELIRQDNNSIDIIKPFYVGQDIQRYSSPDIDKWLLYIPWDFKIDDYPAIKQHLEQFKDKLSIRPEVKSNRYPWYALSRYGSKYIEDFEKSKIIYLVFQVKPAFIMDTNNTYSNNATFIYPSEDYFLLGILNSKIGWFLISNSCTEIQNGYQLIYDYFKNIPIPLNVDAKEKEKLEALVKEVVSLNQTLKQKADKFLKRVKDNFDLDKLSKKLEAFYETDFKTFLKELKKKKVTL
ncbi:MAG: Eco57I restriction-modification methylase domain-containing protein, partial [Flavobacteriaceae bacterium]|nr:Eco57I restriction-modification methylase domain-containing protein [Flavobacteriaceae bacterium]